MLDQHVFSKPYFDADGLILAIETDSGQSRPLGFVHTAFGANETLSDLDFRVGIVSQLKVVPGEHEQEVADALMKRALEYLRSRGVREVHCGSHFPRAPFYLGLYGGSEVPGFLVEDKTAIGAADRAGFVTDDKIVVMEQAGGIPHNF